MNRFVILFLAFTSLASSPLFSADASIMQQVFVVKQAFPNLKTIGILAETTHVTDALKEMATAAAAYQVKVKVFHTATLQDVRTGFDQMLKAEKIDLVWILPDDVTDQKFGRRFLSEKCLGLKIPLYVHAPDSVHEGALLSVAPDATGQLRIYFNEKVGQMMSLSLPSEVQPKVIPVQ